MEYDVIIVGAGLSGIGAAAQLKRLCPNKTFTVLEARERMGGTWDLFKYPGIRSDSDMYTFGYSFRPWRGNKALADGASIKQYIEDTAKETGVDRHIQYNRRVTAARWSSTEQRWSIELKDGDTLKAKFLYVCSGYYNYDEGYTPPFEGMDELQGRLVHAQKWTEDIAYEGKRVVVIGSGATAITLVPELAKKAAHVTMLQRSPTYVVSLPGEDKVALWFQKLFPAGFAHDLARWKNVLRAMLVYVLSRRFPSVMAKLFTMGVRQATQGKVAVDPHFAPKYKPWDQRLCMVPDEDLFVALREGKASIVTAATDRFVREGVRLASGEVIEADLIVLATGLKLQVLGGAALEVDGRRVNPPDHYMYKGVMISDVPNFAYAVGYTNASWTLKCDLASEWICRVLRYMDANGQAVVTPRQPDGTMALTPVLDLASGYVQRANDILPRQGDASPWRLYQNYVLDLLIFRHAPIEDGLLELRADPNVPSRSETHEAEARPPELARHRALQ